MNNKFLKVIAVIFGVLLLAALLPSLGQKKGESQVGKQPNLSVKMSDFTKESVNKIAINLASDEKILELQGERWFMGETEVDAEKVAQLFQDFADLQIKETAAQNESSHAKFEVTKETGIQLSLTQNGKEAVFLVGKIGGAENDFYLRKAGIANVYLVNGHLREKLTWTVEQWKKAAEETPAADKI